MRKHSAIIFSLLMGLLLSEGSLHVVLHADHHAEEHHASCEGHHHEADPNADSICSHEHQCELCVLFQNNTNFLPELKISAVCPALAKVDAGSATTSVFFKPLEASSPRAPPVA